jgi:hypothetical protein
MTNGRRSVLYSWYGLRLRRAESVAVVLGAAEVVE